MAFLNNTNTQKHKRSLDEKPKRKKRAKKEMTEEPENNNKNEGFDLINSLIDLNEGNLTTDDSPSDLTMLDAEFGNNIGGENLVNNDEDSGNEGLQIIEDAESAENVIEEQQPVNNNTNNDENTKNNNNEDANKSVATAIIHETPNKTIDTTKTFTSINDTTTTTILEDPTEDDSLLLGKMVVCTHRILKSEGMDCEAIGLEKSVYELLINYKQMRAEYAKKIKGEK
ncbi:unnamed protein product [Meloidogyne enterolobii]|uniref:Uncharacterized protein n=1 Tax=Meloidogyne enterolobii TaxID=390850 RepID=A0ACB1AU38_MELEN